MILAIALAVATPSASSAEAQPSIPVFAEDEAALEAATRTVCDKDVVLLGEAAHGNGHSDAFKSAMVERLVTRCGFRAVLFEASFYEFVPLWRAKRAGYTITPGQIGTAVGGMWKFNREFQSLLSFLSHWSNQGVFLGGFDFQVGGLDQDFTNQSMIADLTAKLSDKKAGICKSIFQARIDGDLDSGQKKQARTCIASISTMISHERSAMAQEQRMMISNLDAIFQSGFGQGITRFNQLRDRQMFRDIQMLRANLPRSTRIVIWTANGHAANGADGENGFDGVRNLGSYIAEAYGSRSYALANTALGGEQRWGKDHKPLPASPEGSLESLAFKSGAASTVFFDNAALKSLGSIPSAVFNFRYHSAEWWRRFGGIVVFHEEHAAFSSRFDN